MSDLEELTNEVVALEGRRDGLKMRIAELEGDLETAKAEHDERIKAEVSRRQRKRGWKVALAGASFLAVVLVWVFVVGDIEEETLTGHVTSATSARSTAPARDGAACTVTFERIYGPYNVHLRVECGGSRLYGNTEGSGAISCDTEGSRVTRCEDVGNIGSDGDPRVRLDRRLKVLTVDDGRRWQVEIALD